MITWLYLKNFKCFSDLELPLKSFTLLAGLNGSGKSTVIQSLLVLRQSTLNRRTGLNSLRLAGELVDIGTGQDVLFDGAEVDEIVVGLGADSQPKDIQLRRLYRFPYDRKSERLPLRSKPYDRGTGTVRDKTILEPEDYRVTKGSWSRLKSDSSNKRLFDRAGWRPLFSIRSFTYLGAERLGPRKSLPMSEERIQAKEIGASGEFVLHYLLEHGSSLVGATESLFDPRLFEGAPQRTLHDQSVAWLREVSPGTSLEIDAVRGIDLAFARFSFERQGDVPTRGFRPSNVGFGLSYTLPVIVALLAANPGDIVIIENPEAHLHPRGQTRLGQLAARTASAGIQVIAETHSDHFMDGVRIEVRESRIDPGEVAFHYFQRRDGRAAVASPVIDDDGRLSEWPTGFFDQHDENLARLIASEE